MRSAHVRAQEGEVRRTEAVARRRGLVPERVQERRRAQPVEPRALVAGEPQVGGAEVVRELLVRPGADDERAHARAAEQPRERDLRGGDAVRLADLHERVDDVVELRLVADRRLVPVGQVPRPRGPSCPRRYLPESRPPASGLQTRMPTPWSIAAGTISYSTSRACSE